MRHMSQVPGRMAPPGHVVSSPSWGPEPVIPYRMVAIVCAAAMLLLLLRACCPAADAFPLRFTGCQRLAVLLSAPCRLLPHLTGGWRDWTKTNGLQTPTSNPQGRGRGVKTTGLQTLTPPHREGGGIGQSQWPAHPNPQPTGGWGGCRGCRGGGGGQADLGHIC